MAAIRRHGDVAFGNILGIAGVTAVVSPISVPAEIAVLDTWVMLGTAVLLVVVAISRWRVSRFEASIFLALYALYLAVQFMLGLQSSIGIT